MPFDNDQGCNRKFVSSIIEPQIEPIVFRSNRNVFLFGRSGAINLKYEEENFEKLFHFDKNPFTLFSAVCTALRRNVESVLELLCTG